MKIKTGHKFALFLVSTIAAVVLCTLPFLAVKKDTLYVYTNSPELLSSEQGFIRELRRLGVNVVVNSTTLPKANSYGLWFKNPEHAAELAKSPAKLNFLYTESYYPIEWADEKTHPVILTPYHDLYEHYVRSNIKTAKFNIGVNTTDFYVHEQEKKYPLVYVGDNNKDSPVVELLQSRPEARFIGAFWSKNQLLPLDENNPVKKSEALSSSKIAVIYNAPNMPASKKIPTEVMEAAASGALVFSSPNQEVTALYGDNVIIYDSKEDLINKYQYYLERYKAVQNKIIAAQNITTEKLSSVAAASRFKAILDWLKENQIN